MGSKTKILIKNICIFAVGNVLVKLIALFLMPLYTSQMTTAEYGVAELLNNLIEIVLPVATLCIIDAVYRYSIDDNSDLTGLFTNAVGVILKGIVPVVAGCAIGYFISKYAYLPYFVGLYIATTFHNLCSQFARGLGHAKRYAAGGVINALCLVAFNVILLVWLDGGVEAYLISLTASHLVAGVFHFVTSKEYRYIDFSRKEKSLKREMLRFSIPNIFNNLSWWLNNISSRYIILFFLGSAAAGLYTAASKLPAVINMLAAIFQQAWQYSTSKEIDQKNSGTFFTNVFRYYIMLIVLACSAIILLMPYLAGIILKGEFYNGWRYVPLLLVSAAIGCISSFFGTFYMAVKKNKMAMVTTIIGAIVNIAINLLFVKTLGIVSAIIASVLSFTVITTLRIINTAKFSHVNCNWVGVAAQFSLLIAQSVLWLCQVPNAILFEIVIFALLLCLNLKNLIFAGRQVLAYISKIKRRGESHGY